MAFKYQPKIEIQDLPHAIKIAKSYLDVITTSGSATGRAANPTEVKFMREFSGNHPLALASGVQPENIHDYIKDIDISIVGT
ncbi:hypothetical protein KA013_03010 [Patescibacteria group bacterium]|nr:hypothetical protein [Patescibacteria group bacterium]